MSKIFLIGAIIMAGVGLIALGAYAVLMEARACEQAGGKILSKTVTGVGVMGNGQVGPTFSTVSFCVTPDGRIIK